MKITQVASALAVSALATSAFATGASAQTCPRGAEFRPTADPAANIFEMEGPIVSYDIPSRTIIGVGVKATFPAGVLFDTGPKFVTFEELTDPALNQGRSIIGGTIAAGGLATDPDGDGCANLTAQDAHFTFREDVMGGPLPLESIVVGDGTLVGGGMYVNGTYSVLDVDPRSPGTLVDASNNPDITWADLAGFEGRPMSVEGYYEDGKMKAWLIEADAYKVNPAGIDNVITVQARWYPDKLETKLVGYVEPRGATWVDIYTGGDVAIDAITGKEYCTGTYRARVATFNDPDVPTQARFVWDSGVGNDPTMPEKACITSEGGDSNRRAFEPWRRLEDGEEEPIVP